MLYLSLKIYKENKLLSVTDFLHNDLKVICGFI